MQTLDREPWAISVAWVLRWTMALLMLGSAGIHFAAMGEHAGVSWTHGLFFGFTAWAQVMLAALLVLGPARRSIQAMILFNFAVIVVWLVSRTVGIAIGTDGTPESVEFADALCAAFEAVAIGLGLVYICGGVARRRIHVGAGWAIGGVVAVVVIALSSFGFSPAIVDSSGGGGHTHADAVVAAAAPATGAVSATHTHVHGSTGSSTATDLNGHVDPGRQGPGRRRGGPGRRAARPRRPARCCNSSSSSPATPRCATRRPTPPSPRATTSSAGFGPGSGAHYIGGYGGIFGAFDPSKPLALIYDGTSPTSQMVGLMYYGMGDTAPEGFAGPNDHWHRHSNVCTRGAEVLSPPDADITEAQCKGLGGFFMKITGWMVHAWVVPSWESPDGVFSHENPNLRCADGTFDTDTIGRCQGS